MATRRRWLQFSLRTFLVLLTALAVWLGVASHRMREQREAVKAIETLGGTVAYDWQYERLTDEVVFDRLPGKHPGAPAWLRRLVGDDFFQEVVGVAFFRAPSGKSEFQDEEIRRWIPHLQKFPKLRVLLIDGSCSDEAMNELTKALPGCNFI
ncbi:MAG TPA: hypothetical protein VMV10_17290 [Pirellulales bacterium]|nr:hypothetical protein [Pirellulales bacterium]